MVSLSAGEKMDGLWLILESFQTSGTSWYPNNNDGKWEHL